MGADALKLCDFLRFSPRKCNFQIVFTVLASLQICFFPDDADTICGHAIAAMIFHAAFQQER
jgi:hypothetical protein